jgi:hypothetical protein
VASKHTGDVRFQAQVSADGLQTPVLREESTRVFGDEGETSSPPTPSTPTGPPAPPASSTPPAQPAPK